MTFRLSRCSACRTNFFLKRSAGQEQGRSLWRLAPWRSLRQFSSHHSDDAGAKPCEETSRVTRLRIRRRTQFHGGEANIGELTWEIVGDHFVNHVHPLGTRSAEELAERAQKTAEHKAYRAKLYKQYSLAERLTDLKT